MFLKLKRVFLDVRSGFYITRANENKWPRFHGPGKIAAIPRVCVLYSVSICLLICMKSQYSQQVLFIFQGEWIVLLPTHERRRMACHL